MFLDVLLRVWCEQLAKMGLNFDLDAISCSIWLVKYLYIINYFLTVFN